MKKNKGITIISLIITIIVIIILAFVTIFYGLQKNADKAMETKSVYEVYSVIDAVVNRALLNRLNPSYYTFVGKSDFGSRSVDGEEYKSEDGWYLVNTSDLKDLGLDNVKGEYLVNYSDGSIVSIDPIAYKGEVYYSLNDLKREMGGGATVLSQVEYDENKKVNKPVLSSGMVPVKISGGKWVVANTDDDDWYDYSKDQMAWANVMLKDELVVDGFNNEQVRNAALSEIVGKEVIKEGSAYVWIPRYTATSLGETESEIIFSNLTNDTTTANGKTYILPEAFTYSEGGERIDLPGIWVSKYEASFDR
ncbi:MAG: hypothetical protein IJ220_06235 [Clostridia bacterium]|nr:hypothetical protein [Clostridia bacterium]